MDLLLSSSLCPKEREVFCTLTVLQPLVKWATGLPSPQHGQTAEPAFLLGALLGSNYQEAAVFLAHQAAFLFVLDPALA